ncbi:hypothetical protein KC19_6G066500 [Ceratodon purpureus]|uniref:Uncharacterized protein n=1 Tax=Ceratodon purpureus TaxID=3225 RepID=A0A8T0HDW5_CERPU|nr:hypothetical protein KC19_6G066500 [Ceratodon purpureus]
MSILPIPNPQARDVLLFVCITLLRDETLHFTPASSCLRSCLCDVSRRSCPLEDGFTDRERSGFQGRSRSQGRKWNLGTLRKREDDELRV